MEGWRASEGMKKIILTIKVNWERYMRVRDAWQQHYFCFARLLFVFGKIGLKMSSGGLAFRVFNGTR